MNVKSATRVLDLLELLSGQDRAMRLREIVQTLELPKSSVHGLLSTLVNRGYVTRDNADRYALVEAFRTSFGWVGGFEARLKALAMPVMQAASDESGETLFLSVGLGNGDARRVCKVVSRHPIRYDSDSENPLPGYATVAGRVLLAFSDPELVETYLSHTNLVPLTAHTVTSTDRLKGVLAGIRANGFGTIEEEFALGGCGIAVPIHGADGRVVAVLNVATVTQRYAANRERLLEVVRRAGSQLELRLGYRSPSLAKES